MKAVVISDRLDGTVDIKDVPVPEMGHGQVLAKIEYSGICHTDLHVAAAILAKSPVEDAQAIFDEMHAGLINGRMVLDFTGGATR